MSTTEDKYVAIVARWLSKKDHRQATTEIAAMVLALLRRVEQLEQRPTLKYSGVWLQGITYEAGEFVTVSGSLWYCERQSSSRPGTDSSWRLAVKQGVLPK